MLLTFLLTKISVLAFIFLSLVTTKLNLWAALFLLFLFVLRCALRWLLLQLLAKTNQVSARAEGKKIIAKFMMMTFLWIRLNKCTMCLILLDHLFLLLRSLLYRLFNFRILQCIMKNCRKI